MVTAETEAGAETVGNAGDSGRGCGNDDDDSDDRGGEAEHADCLDAAWPALGTEH